jgi:hypothetical protein
MTLHFDGVESSVATWRSFVDHTAAVPDPLLAIAGGGPRRLDLVGFRGGGVKGGTWSFL